MLARFIGGVPQLIVPDNARALIVTVHLEELGLADPDVERLATRYAAFLQAALA